jgi:DNA-binding FrmR family transcriptional regulator
VGYQEKYVDEHNHDHNHDHSNAIQRLKTAEGHLRGVQRMLEDQAYCIDVIRQIQAVQSALNKVSTMILDDHLNSCLVTAVQGDDPKERERVLREIADVFETATKV